MEYFSNSIKRIVLLIISFLFSSSAYAHLADAQIGFMSGLTHPVLGVDHLLAMLAVGIVSVQLGEKYVFVVPSVFVVLMIIGAFVGVAGISVPFVEIGISLSVLLLGLVIIIVRSDRFWYVVMFFVGYFGFLHGYAHGAEIPEAIDPIFFGGGFFASTVTIHLLGVGIGQLFKIKPQFYYLLRSIGAALACAGTVLLFRVIA